ncbi:hypothetical protein NU195Hw_g2030t1 [Hortaea werneckii]
MSYVPAFERRYKSIGNVLSAITDYASRDTVIREAKSRLSKVGNATTSNAAAIANEVSVLNTALAHAAEQGRVEDVSHLAEELNSWVTHHVDVGERTALASLRQENAGHAKVVEQELSQLRDTGREKDTRIRELEAATTFHQDAAQQLRDKSQTQAVTLEARERTIQSLQTQLEQQKQASVTEVTEWKGKLEQTRSELHTQLEAKEATIADLQVRLLQQERAVDELRARKEKAWEEADKTVGIANEVFKAKAAIDVSKALREEGEQRNKQAESAIQRMSKFCSPTQKATVGRPTNEDIESVLQRMKSVLDSENTTVEEMD